MKILNAAASVLALTLAAASTPHSSANADESPTCGCVLLKDGFLNSVEWLCPDGQKYIIEKELFRGSTVRAAKDGEGSCVFRKEEQSWLCDSAKISVRVVECQTSPK